jgi:hypothetical protein
MIREMGYGLQSLAEEAWTNEWIHGGIQNILRSKAYKTVVAVGVLSAALDTSNAIGDIRQGEFNDLPSSAVHIGVELAAVETLRRLIPGHIVTLDQTQTVSPGNVLSLSNG